MTLFEQKDFDTCLASCLIFIYQKSVPNRKIDIPLLEKKLYISAFGKYHRGHFALKYAQGFIDLFNNTTVKVFIEDKKYANHLQTLLKDEVRLQLCQQNITTEWLKSELKKNLIIVMVDMLHLGFRVHDTHYIVLNSFKNGRFEVFEPRDGSIRKVSEIDLVHALNGLRYQLWWSPVALTVSVTVVL